MKQIFYRHLHTINMQIQLIEMAIIGLNCNEEE